MAPIEQAYVYILSSTFKHLYIGITTRLMIRVAQHKQADAPNSFTARYKINQLVYVETYAYITSAIAREKQLERWSRIKKINLIVQQNPTWQDLSLEWAKPIELYRWPENSIPKADDESALCPSEP